MSESQFQQAGAFAGQAPPPVDTFTGQLRSPMCSSSGAFALTAGTAYFVYLGRVTRGFTVAYIEAVLLAGGSGTQVAELGLFTTPDGPNKAGQDLTPLAATDAVDDLTAGTVLVVRNTDPFNADVAAGLHLWAGIRADMDTPPTLAGLVGDHGLGTVLETAGADPLTEAGPWEGDVPDVPGSGIMPLVPAAGDPHSPDLRVTAT